MQLNDITKPASLKGKRRIGRGGKRGTFSGKGSKGQKARSGGSIAPGFEGSDTTTVSRSPKIIGFTSPKLPNLEVNLDLLEKHFKANETVSPEALEKKGLVKRNKRSRSRKIAKVKILGTGKITKALVIDDCLMSEKAKKAIVDAGGKLIEKKKKEEKAAKTETQASVA